MPTNTYCLLSNFAAPKRTRSSFHRYKRSSSFIKTANDTRTQSDYIPPEQSLRLAQCFVFTYFGNKLDYLEGEGTVTPTKPDNDLNLKTDNIFK